MNILQRIENVVLQHESEFTVSSNDGRTLDNSIHMLSAMLTEGSLHATAFFDLKDESGEILYGQYGDGDYIERMCVEKILSYLIDVSYVAQSDRNLLNKAGFHGALARTLVKKGTPVSLAASLYGWKDFSRDSHGGIVAILSAYEDYWGHFEGTFAENSYHTGLSGTAVYADGTQRYIRCETDLSDFIQTILKS